MKIAIFGAGAIGGLLAVKLHQAGAQVSVIARGPHLAAIRERGLTLTSEGQTTTVQLPAFAKAKEAGEQDYVIVTLKANGLPAAAPEDRQADGASDRPGHRHQRHSLLVFLRMAWQGPWRDHIVESVDPGGQLWQLLPPQQTIGCIVYPAAEVIQPWGDRACFMATASA